MVCLTFAADFSTIAFMKTDKTYTLTTKRLVHIATSRLLFWLAFALVGCGDSQEERQKDAEEFCIAGTWKLNELLFLSGQRVDVHTGYEYVWYRFFEDDGTYYVAELNDSDYRKPVKPHEMSEYFFMMSPYDTVYIEHGRMTDLHIMDHHTIGVDRGNYVEIYAKSNQLPVKRVAEIERTVEKSLRPNHGRTTQYIVPIPSKTEHAYVWVWIVALVVVFGAGSLYLYNKVKVNRQQSVTEKNAENHTEETQQEQPFIHSDYYLALRQRLYEGPTLKQDEWEELEAQMKSACPQFFRRLAEMGQLSEVELRVCMLTKLGIPPSAIAIHTCREYSSISSIRSRLYYKLFGKKGGAKQLDDYIRNL